MTTVLQTLVVEAYWTEPSFKTELPIACFTARGSVAPLIDRKLA